MCLSLSASAKKQIAKTDIVCYKFVEPKIGRLPWSFKKGTVLYTPFRYMKIQIGKTYSSNLKYSEFHNAIEEGLHSFIDIPKFADFKVIVECIIPKGASYYTGEFNRVGSYASNKLKYVKILFPTFPINNNS